MFTQRLFGLVDERGSFVLCSGQFLTFAVFVCVCFGVLADAFDFFLRQSAGLFDLDRMLFAGGLVAGGHAENPVDIDIEFHFDLWNTAWCGGNSVESEFIEQAVITGHLAFALEHAHCHCGLVVSCGGEGFGFCCGDRGVAFHEHRHDAAFGFDAQ